MFGAEVRGDRVETTDPRGGNGRCTRQCPTPVGDARSLITHRIGVAECMRHQREFYHKCNRCQYRGKAADYSVEQPIEEAAQSASA